MHGSYAFLVAFTCVVSHDLTEALVLNIALYTQSSHIQQWRRLAETPQLPETPEIVMCYEFTVHIM